MKRVTFNVSDLVYYRLKEYARNEAGTTMSRVVSRRKLKLKFCADAMRNSDTVLLK